MIDDREARRRAADAANGCAQKPKPEGKPRDLVLAALRWEPATRQEVRELTALECRHEAGDLVADARRLGRSAALAGFSAHFGVDRDAVVWPDESSRGSERKE